MRTSRKDLERLVEKIAKLQGRPTSIWTRYKVKEKGRIPTEELRSNIGALHLEFVREYGGWDLVEICNDKGAESSLIGNTFGGRGRLNAHEMETFLLGMLTGIEGTQYWSGNKTRKSR